MSGEAPTFKPKVEEENKYHATDENGNMPTV